MFNSFSSALSALRAHSTAIDTVGHNLANVNTTGFKAAGVAFKDVVAESMGNGKSETGMGVSRPVTVRNFSQGSIQATSGMLDAAIQGNGFFAVRNPSQKDPLLTRDGGFQLDSKGYVVTTTGERVQQYSNGVLSDIQIPAGASPSAPTTGFQLTANLNATSAVGDTFSTPVEVVDSLGVVHMLTVRLTKEDASSWSYDVLIPGADVGETDPLVSIFGTPPSTRLEFDATGRLTAPEADSGALELSIEGLASGANDLSISWNLYNDKAEPIVTQFAQNSAVSKTSQDGYPAAEVVSVGMADGGKIVAVYGNGEQKTIAQLAVAMISNPSSLTGAGNNMFRPGIDSSRPAWGVAETGGRGTVRSGALESSTVDIAREFTNLIVYQRGYQANSRVITTADEISQETLNLKR